MTVIFWPQSNEIAQTLEILFSKRISMKKYHKESVQKPE